MNYRRKSAVTPVLGVTVLGITVLGVLVLTCFCPVVKADNVKGDTVTDEYYARLAKVSPRDATGFFELAGWCRDQGLSAERSKALQRTIKIDPDHAGARKALGYRRYGLGWRLAKDIPKPGKSKARSSKKSSRSTKSSKSSTGSKKTARDETTDTDTDTGDSDTETRSSPEDTESTGDGGTPTSEVDSKELGHAERLEKKRAFAREAAEKSGLTLNTSEDKRGFLIHSTRDSSSKDVKELAVRLRSIRKNIIKAIGLRGSNFIWPHKIQIFFLRKLECSRFSETVLDRPFPQNARWEAIDEYSLLVTKISDLDLTEFMARTALRFRGGQERWIPSWIEEGAAHIAAAMTEEGKERGMHEQAYLTTLSQLENTPDRSPLIDMLELTDVTQRNPQRNRKVVLTLIDFLNTARKRRFTKFVDAATEGLNPPKDRASKDFKNFYIDYFQRQEDVFKKVYRMDLSQLDEKWQAFVFERTKRINDKEREKSKGRRSKSRR